MDNRAIILANSIWFLEHNKDDVLTDFQWINDNLLNSGKLTAEDLSTAAFEQLFDLRKLVIDVLETDDFSNYIESINEYMAKASFKHKVIFKNDQLIRYHVSGNTLQDQLLSKVASDLVKLYINTQTIVKRCMNDECQFFYVDNSKNKSKKFCSNRCSNLIKVRRHRQNKSQQDRI